MLRCIALFQSRQEESLHLQIELIVMVSKEADEPVTVNATASVLSELAGTREEVARAREAAVKAWLSSMPLDEELERLRAELASAKNSLAATAAEIGLLKSAVESTNDAIVAKKEEAGRKREAVEELRRRVGHRRAEIRRLRSEVAAARGEKDALEQRVLVRRQAVLALQLAERTVEAEAHALAWTSAAAAGDVDVDAAHHEVVALPARRLEELRRGVEAEARVEEVQTFRRAKKARRAAASARLVETRARKREAADQGRRRDDAENGHGGNEGKRSRSGRTCLAVRRLRSLPCTRTSGHGT